MDHPRFVIREATPKSLAEVAETARCADVAELWASSHMTPAQVLDKALRLSPETFVCWYGDTPICAFGVMPISSVTGWGAPWMVATYHLDGFGPSFLKASKRTVQRMLASWPILTNFVDVRNTRAISWLRWLGFEFEPAAPHGLDGLDFHRFEMRSSHV